MADRKTELLENLKDARANLNTLVGKLAPEDWETTIQDEDQHWTVRQLFAHLASAQKGMTNQIMNINQGQEGAPADFDLDRWNRRSVEKSVEKTATILLNELHEGQLALFQVIEGLNDSDLDKKGRHGSLRIMTIAEIAQTIAQHERDHAAIIGEKLGKQPA